MRRHLLAVVLMIGFVASVHAGDWPTYMHDNARGGVTDESLDAASLAEHWRVRSPAPIKPAWPDPQAIWELPKMKFDDAFYTVAADGGVYFGSSVDHQVYAIDAATGRIRWRFFTGAPIRTAPTIADGRVFVGSDDGLVYCLDAKDGRAVWSFNAAASPRMVLGNGSVMSLWPIRTGVMLDGGRLYFAGGIFPHHQPLIHALNPATGEPFAWDGRSEKSWERLTPQGYFLRTPHAIIVPGGRTMPLAIDPVSGNPVHKLVESERQGTGGGAGDYGVVIGDKLYLGTQNALYGYDTKTGAVKDRWLSVRQIAATKDTIYTLNAPLIQRFRKTSGNDEFTGVSAYDRDKPNPTPLTGVAPPLTHHRWRVARDGVRAIVVAGKHVVVGGRNEVVLLDASDGREAWKSAVDGDAVGLTIADGRLIVSTTAGTVHCFAPGKAALVDATPRRVGGEGDANVKRIAEEFVRESGVTRGYAVLAGDGAVELAVALATHTELQITCMIDDVGRLQAARERAASTGHYGSRVTVQPAKDGAWAYPDYIANLVVSHGDRAANASELFRVLKPMGGVLLTEGTGFGQTEDADAKGAWAIPREIKGGGVWSKFVRGELPGSGWWTKAFADAGNSGSSGDQRIKGDLAVLWFGEPGAGEAIDRHERTMSPLAIGGRVFFQGWGSNERNNSIICFDLYNGLRYWERDLPGAVRLRLPAVAGNMVCTESDLFVVTDTRCERIDTGTGKTKAVYETMRDAKGNMAPWGYVSVAGNILLGSTSLREENPGFHVKMDAGRGKQYGNENTGLRFSDTLFAIDLGTGKTLWTYQGKEIRDSTIALNNGRVFFAENRGGRTALPARSPEGDAFYHAEPTGRDDDGNIKIDRLGKQVAIQPAEKTVRHIVALDVRTGKPVWDREVDLTGCGIWGASASTRQAAGYRELQALSRGGVLMFAASYDQHDGVPAEDQRARRAVALSTADGSTIWSASISNRNRPILLRDSFLAGNLLRDLRTGEPLMTTDPKKGVPVPWEVVNGGACGTPSACDSMVFFRNGSTAWRDFEINTRVQFYGIRPGCFTNILPVGGLVIQPEASSGCTCNYSVQCTIALQPVGERRPLTGPR